MAMMPDALKNALQHCCMDTVADPKGDNTLQRLGDVWLQGRQPTVENFCAQGPGDYVTVDDSCIDAEM
ncbi:MAG: hypothetical protein IPM18_05470 [Phycisphaerales bacterium]|nr:hypothetical protein [Phycisphaerales bacterium]